MTETEQTVFISRIVIDSLRDVKEGFKTRLEAMGFVRGYLLAAVVLGFMADEEQKKIISNFKSKLEQIKKEGADNEHISKGNI